MEKVLALDSQFVTFNGITKHNSEKGKNLKRMLVYTNITKRPECETDYNLKQLICYGFITHKDKIFITQRLNKQAETRLHNLYSIGIGGHSNPMRSVSIMDTLESNMVRELHEEVNIDNYNINLYGFINDDTNDVGKVHLGIVYHIDSFNTDVSIKEIDKMEGRFISISELDKYYNNMETWSQILSRNI